jgi:ankyrin repeat protein
MRRVWRGVMEAEMRTAGAALLIAVLVAVAHPYAEGPQLPLLDAVQRGDRVAVQAILKQHADVNQAAKDGTTALHWAVERNDVETAQLLLRAGAQVQAANRYGATPLYAACLNANPTMIELLLRAGAKANSSLPGGETALMTAARVGNVEVLKSLLARGADVNAVEGRGGQTALMWAAAEGHAEAIRTLLESGAKVDTRSKSGLSAFLFAVREGRFEAVRALLASGIDVNDSIKADGDKAAAAENGGVAGQRRMGPSSAFRGMSALGVAIANAHFDLAVALLDAGANTNDDVIGWTPLHQLMFTRRPNPEAVVYAVPLTARVDSLALAKALLDHGADVNARMRREPCNTGGITDAGDARRVETPLQTFYLPCFDQFGNRNNMNRIGATALLLAAKGADADMMEFLASHGADPLLPNVEGVTPLMAASGVGIYKVGLSPGTNEEALAALKMALKLGGDVNTVDKNGDTALHGAAVRGSNELIQLLVERGAKLDVVNALGWTPLTIADGVRYTQTLVVAPESASLLRRLMAEKGLAVPPPPTASTTAAKGLAAK